MSEQLTITIDNDVSPITFKLTKEQLQKLYKDHMESKPDEIIDDNYNACFPINLTPTAGKRKLRVTLPFNSSDPPYSPSKRHFGLDVSPYAGAGNEPIFSILDGKVYKVVYQREGYGNYVVVEYAAAKNLTAKRLTGLTHSIPQGHKFYVLYTHCSKIYVSEGQEVSCSDVIATIGSTGFSSGPHVHFEVRAFPYYEKIRINPLEILGQLLRPNEDGWYFIAK